ncbi:D(1)-like dopamine receptor [Orbicella faveolata]|uniref:D(1)-like dopamine receptor n=1 Tax=Orbicella faveolata TaxID=48498 RepID=UPI0009E2286C|nr:D(1)-like dopamine receptor [Orbicella faveolata]
MTTAKIVIPISVLAVLVIIANGAVCLLVCINRNLRTYTNGFIVSLAVSDILVGVTLFLQYALSVVSPVALNILYTTALVGSVANLSAVTFDRHLACMKPFNYAEIIAKYFGTIVTLCWLTAVTSAVLPVCWLDSDVAALALKIYQFCILILGIAAPYIWIFLCYLRIFRQVRKIVKREKEITNSVHGRSLNESTANRVSSEAKVAKVFGVIAVMFVLSWLPIIWTTLVYAVGKPHLLPEAITVLSPFTLAFGSIINPVIYSFMKPDFRTVGRKLLYSNALPQFSFKDEICSQNKDEFLGISRITVPSIVHSQSLEQLNI